MVLLQCRMELYRKPTLLNPFFVLKRRGAVVDRVLETEGTRMVEDVTMSQDDKRDIV